MNRGLTVCHQETHSAGDRVDLRETIMTGMPAADVPFSLTAIDCGAAAAMATDGKRRPLWYLTERGRGLAGTGSNVEFCLSGNPSYIHHAQCGSLR